MKDLTDEQKEEMEQFKADMLFLKLTHKMKFPDSIIYKTRLTDQEIVDKQTTEDFLIKEKYPEEWEK